MNSNAERAVWALEEAVDGVLSFVRASSYGMRLAVKRVGDLTVRSPSLGGAGSPTGAEMERLVEALEEGEDQLSDVAILALGDYFRAFLARALELPQVPPLPPTPSEVENLTGTPGALAKTPSWFPLILELYRTVLRGGRLNKSSLDALGIDALELAYPGGKVKMHREGDHVTLTEHQLAEAAQALVEAAKAIRLRLLTA